MHVNSNLGLSGHNAFFENSEANGWTRLHGEAGKGHLVSRFLSSIDMLEQAFKSQIPFQISLCLFVQR